MGVSLLECSFLIPICGDQDLGGGQEHEQWIWRWLDAELYRRFGGATQASGQYQGFYADPDTKERVADTCLKFYVALNDRDVDELRQLLKGACYLFQQKCIYLSIGGHVEFVKASDE